MIRVKISTIEAEDFTEQMKRQGYEPAIVDAVHTSFKRGDEVSDIFLENREFASYIIYLPDSRTDVQQQPAVEPSWRANPDRMGGQFTDEEIRMSERGGYGW